MQQMTRPGIEPRTFWYVPSSSTNWAIWSITTVFWWECSCDTAPVTGMTKIGPVYTRPLSRDFFCHTWWVNHSIGLITFFTSQILSIFFIGIMYCMYMNISYEENLAYSSWVAYNKANTSEIKATQPGPQNSWRVGRVHHDEWANTVACTRRVFPTARRPV